MEMTQPSVSLVPVMSRQCVLYIRQVNNMIKYWSVSCLVYFCWIFQLYFFFSTFFYWFITLLHTSSLFFLPPHSCHLMPLSSSHLLILPSYPLPFFLPPYTALLFILLYPSSSSSPSHLPLLFYSLPLFSYPSLLHFPPTLPHTSPTYTYIFPIITSPRLNYLPIPPTYFFPFPLAPIILAILCSLFSSHPL